MDKFTILPKIRLLDFFAALKEFGVVYAPVRVSEKSFSFKSVEKVEDIAFEALRTILPPKKFFFKPEEALVSYEDDSIKTVEPEFEKFVLFGVHPCDLAGLGVMDSIYSEEPGDYHYLKRRNSALIVGLSCMPDKHCFCKSMGTDKPDQGYDLFLTELEDDYFIQIKNSSGLKFVERNSELFIDCTSSHMKKFNQYWIERDQAFESCFDGSNLPSLMDMNWDSKLFEDLGERCLSCGNCTPVCPTCYCFDVFDLPSLHANQGQRVRQWDSCQFVGFAKVAGEHNFRPGPVDRLKFWYRHKLHGFDDAYQFPTCVGCGRCTESCPSGIDDIVNVVLRMQGKPSILITDDKSE